MIGTPKISLLCSRLGFEYRSTSWLCQIKASPNPACPPQKHLSVYLVTRREGRNGWPSGIIGEFTLDNFVITDYSMKLLNELRAHRLLSNRLFVAWLVDILAISNLAQVGFIAQLIGDYLPEITRHLSLARACIRAACSKISEVRSSVLKQVLISNTQIHSSPAPNALSKIEQVLRHIVIVSSHTSAFPLLTPSLWLSRTRRCFSVQLLGVNIGTLSKRSWSRFPSLKTLLRHLVRVQSVPIAKTLF